MPLPNEKKVSQFIEERVKEFRKLKNSNNPNVNISSFIHHKVVEEFLINSLELQRQKFIEGIEKPETTIYYADDYGEGYSSGVERGKEIAIEIIKSL